MRAGLVDPAVLLAGGLTAIPLAQAAANQDAIALSGAEIAIVGGLLAAVTGALTFVFRLLLQAKNEQLQQLANRVTLLETQVNETQAQLVTLLTGVIEKNREAMERTGAALTQTAIMLQALRDGTVEQQERYLGGLKQILDHLVAART